MDIKSITIVAIRLIAIYLGLSALSSRLPALGSYFTGSNSSDALLMAVLIAGYGLLYLAGCAILWPLAPKITNAICKGFHQEQTPTTELNIANAQIAVLSILGFYILSLAVPSLVRIMTAVTFPSYNSKFNVISHGLNSELTTIIPWSDISFLIVRLAIGIWLVIGSTGIVNLVLKIRNAAR